MFSCGYFSLKEDDARVRKTSKENPDQSYCNIDEANNYANETPEDVYMNEAFDLETTGMDR